MKNYAIIGASGLIGSCIVDELLQTTDNKITLISRRALGLSNLRIHEVIVDFTNQSALNEALKGVDAVFIAIGTTQKKMKGDLSAYRKVDYDIPVAVAQACVINNVPKLLMVSSAGADSSSSNFYLRIKGEVEHAIEKMPIQYIGIFQPFTGTGKHGGAAEQRIGGWHGPVGGGIGRAGGGRNGGHSHCGRWRWRFGHRRGGCTGSQQSARQGNKEGIRLHAGTPKALKQARHCALCG